MTVLVPAPAPTPAPAARPAAGVRSDPGASARFGAFLDEASLAHRRPEGAGGRRPEGPGRTGARAQVRDDGDVAAARPSRERRDVVAAPAEDPARTPDVGASTTDGTSRTPCTDGAPATDSGSATDGTGTAVGAALTAAPGAAVPAREPSSPSPAAAEAAVGRARGPALPSAPVLRGAAPAGPTPETPAAGSALGAAAPAAAPAAGPPATGLPATLAAAGAPARGDVPAALTEATEAAVLVGTATVATPAGGLRVVVDGPDATASGPRPAPGSGAPAPAQAPAQMPAQTPVDTSSVPAPGAAADPASPTGGPQGTSAERPAPHGRPSEHAAGAVVQELPTALGATVAATPGRGSADPGPRAEGDGARPDPAVTGPVAAVPTGAAPPTTPTASAPAVAATAPSPAFTEQLTGGLARLRLAPTGEHVLTVHVTPEDLGPVRVQAHISADGVRIELLGATDASREALRSVLGDLRRDLAATGLDADLRLAADGSGSGPGAQAGDAGTFAGQRRTAGDGAPRSGPNPAAEARRPPDPTPSLPTRRGPGRLDLLA